MGAYLNIILLALKAINAIVKYFDEKKMLDAGAARQIAIETAAINKTVTEIKVLRDEVKSKTDVQLDEELGK